MKRRATFTLLALAATAAGCDALSTGRQVGATVVVALVDPSGSTDARARCGEALPSIRRAVDAPRIRRVDVLILATGNAASGEPELVVPWTTFAPARNLHGSPAARRRARDEFVARVYMRCREALRPTDASPIYEGVARALASIAARCQELRNTKTPCEQRVLSVASDLRSTHGAFGRRLREVKKRGKHEKLAPLDVAGVDIAVCGVSNTAGADGLDTDRVLAAWREVLGAEVAIAPTCEVDATVLEVTR